MSAWPEVDPPLQVTVWVEGRHERSDPEVAALYPDGMNTVIAAAVEEHLGEAARTVTTTLDDPSQGLPDSRLAGTDVLFWWGHTAHDEVEDALVTRIQERVLAGMGLVVLHSGHHSKIFRRLMGTTCNLRWRNEADRELLWTVAPDHPLARGVPSPIILPEHEMYGEYFDIPAPDELVFVSAFSGGEVLRSGCTFIRGRGRVVYFSPGDQDYPVYHHPDVRRVLANAAAWAAPRSRDFTLPPVERAETGWFTT